MTWPALDLEEGLISALSGSAQRRGARWEQQSATAWWVPARRRALGTGGGFLGRRSQPWGKPEMGGGPVVRSRSVWPAIVLFAQPLDFQARAMESYLKARARRFGGASPGPVG